MSHSPWFHRQPTLLPGRALRPDLLYRFRAIANGYCMWTAFALYALYVVRDAHLTPTEAIVVGAVLEGTVVAFEIPTGVLADAVSRRLSVVAGTAVAGAGWAVMGLFPSFEGVLAGQFIWGFGFTFTSGAVDAWLADEIGEETAARTYAPAAQWRQAAVVAGVLTGAALGLVDGRVPFVAGGAGSVALAVFLACTMTEAGWRPSHADSAASRFGALRRVATAGLGEARRRPMVRAAMAIALLFGASSEVFDRLWGFHLVDGVGVPHGVNETLLFGAIAVASQLAAFGVIAAGRRAAGDGTRASAARVLASIYVAACLAPLAFAFSPVAGVAVALIAVSQSTMAAQYPFFAMWVNRGLDPRTRATVLSSVNQANSVGQTVIGVVFAGVVGVVGVPAALAIGALIVLPAVGLVRTRPRADLTPVPEPGG